jgi:hypothetical protein
MRRGNLLIYSAAARRDQLMEICVRFGWRIVSGKALGAR